MLAAGQVQAQEVGPEEEAVAVDEIIVTGTSIRGVPPVGSNLIGVSRADVERLGAANTPDILASVVFQQGIYGALNGAGRPEFVSPAVLALVHADAPNRTIICAGAKSFEAARISL